MDREQNTRVAICNTYGHVPGPWTHHPVYSEFSITPIPANEPVKFEQLKHWSERHCQRCGERQVNSEGA